MRVRVFIDFWNFQLNWNDRMDPQKCDWRALPRAIVAQAALLLQPMGVAEPLVLEETLLYASVDPTTETALKEWLTNTIDRMPSYRVKIRERQPQPKTIHCRACGSEFNQCTKCGTRYAPRPEKGVDAAIVTDLLSLACQRSYDLAILVSSDADFIPAVEYLQSAGLKVINAGWSKRGHDLKRASWASFDLERVAVNVTRK
ncbi:MAG TPA: NYN domain-containing protein, partial [Streptosporangiaceae bacterium]